MMRKEENKNLVAAVIRKAAKENNIQVHELFVMPDHVHLLAVLPHGMLESEAFRILKGRSAYLIFKNKEHIRLRYTKGRFWSTGDCLVTVGYNDYEQTRKYVKEQAVTH